MAVLPDNKDEAMSMKEIAIALGMEISSYTATAKTKRQLSRALRALIKWGWVACNQRQGENGHKAWHNAYWKTQIVKSA